MKYGLIMCALKVVKKPIYRKQYIRKIASENNLDQPVKNESFLQKISHISQIGLLMLGVFGYFYTVVPVFQNQQLQEQTAKLELEKSALEHDKTISQQTLTKLKTQQYEVKQNIQILQEKWRNEKNQNIQLLNNITESKKRELEAKLASINTENKLSNEEKNLDKIRWNLILTTLTDSYAFSILRDMDYSFNSKDNYENGVFILEEEKTWPKPSIKLLSLIEEIHHNTKQIPDSYFIELENYVKSRESLLQCEEPNYKILQAKYLNEIFALEPSVDTELITEMEKIKQEYKGTNQTPVFTDEYKIKQRKIFKLGKLFKLKEKYSKELFESRKKCRNKIDIVIHEMKDLKGVK